MDEVEFGDDGGVCGCDGCEPPAGAYPVAYINGEDLLGLDDEVLAEFGMCSDLGLWSSEEKALAWLDAHGVRYWRA